MGWYTLWRIDTVLQEGKGGTSGVHIPLNQGCILHFTGLALVVPSLSVIGQVYIDH